MGELPHLLDLPKSSNNNFADQLILQAIDVLVAFFSSKKPDSLDGVKESRRIAETLV